MGDERGARGGREGGERGTRGGREGGERGARGGREGDERGYMGVRGETRGGRAGVVPAARGAAEAIGSCTRRRRRRRRRARWKIEKREWEGRRLRVAYATGSPPYKLARCLTVLHKNDWLRAPHKLARRLRALLGGDAC